LRPALDGALAGRCLALVLATGLLLAVPAQVEAQGVRGWARSQVRYLEMQPLQLDTAGVGEVVYDPEGNARVDGRLIWCTSAPCAFYRPVAVQNAVLGSQDVGFTAWGLGLQGLSVTTLIRARDHFSGELDWPLANDPVDVLVAYAEYRKGAARVRLGRQESPSGLGFRSFDGGAVRVDTRGFWGEGFGGRSLARGLNEPAREALRPVEDFVRDQEAYLFGGAVGYRWGVNGLSLRYQREIYSDRAGLLSERASADLHSILPFGIRLRTSADWDFAFARVGKANFTLQRTLASGRILAEVEARRYVPYFDLSTNWGFFDPVAFNEVGMRLNAGFGRDFGVQLGVAAREYEATNVDPFLRPLENRGYRGELRANWRPGPRIAVDAGYDLDWATSAFLHSADGSVRVFVTDELTLQMSGTSFQQFQAFRLGDGRAYGGSLGFDWALSPRVRLDGRLSMIRQSDGRGGPGESWNQLRGGMGLRYEFGSDPGLQRRRRRQ
jgi:hypothetical protein